MNLSIFRDKYPRNVDDGEVYCMCDPKYSKKHRLEFSEDFFSLFIEKNSDGTRNLRLKGNELHFRIGKRLEDTDMALITKFVSKYPTLVKIDLSYNRIGNEGLITLCEGYLQHENPLQHLILTGCDIRCPGIRALSECWPTLKLKTLKLTANKFGSECGSDLFTLLTRNNHLETLDIDATGQTVASIPHIMAALRLDGGTNESLKALDVSDVVPLSRCYQPQTGFLAEHLSALFELNRTLRELHLQKCSIDGHAVEAMLEGLRYNSTLMLLDLGYNKVGNFGAEKLAEWFMTQPAMIGINLAGNSIGEIGGRALSFGLPYSKLRLLDLSQNEINDQALCEILLSIKKSQQIRMFYIFGNTIGQLCMEVLERQIAAGIYEQSHIDFQLFRTPEGLHVAKYHTNDYKHFVYSQLDHADVQELRIRHNKLPSAYCQEHARVNFDYYRVEKPPCDVDAQYEPGPVDEDALRLRCLERERLAALQAEEVSDSSEFGVVPDASSDSCLSPDEPEPSAPSAGNLQQFVSEVQPEKSLQTLRRMDDRSSIVLTTDSPLVSSADVVEKKLSSH